MTPLLGSSCVLVRSLCAAVMSLPLLAAAAADPEPPKRQVLVQGNDKLAIAKGDGTIAWEIPWGPIHDLHVLPGGNIMTQRGASEIVEIDPDKKEVVWSYDSAKSESNEGKRVEVHAF